MPRSALSSLLVVAVLAVVFAGAGPAGAGERWRRPVPGGAVAGAFDFERAAPYQRGRRRGIDLSGRPGAPVLAACTGVVTYRGRVPGRSGRGVSIRCGRLVATELGLSATTVRRGGAVTAGARIGTLGPAGRLRLGARVATDRHGYLDPLALMGDEHAPVAPPPAVRGHRRTRVTGVPRVAPLAPASGRDATPPLPV